jgi:hypothetical protein
LLGEFLCDFITDGNSINSFLNDLLRSAISKSIVSNGFFMEIHIIEAIKSIAKMLNPQKIEEWTSGYPELQNEKSIHKKVGVVLAGNIPMVGFHDMMSVLISGNIFIGKLSHNDRFLLPAIAEILFHIDEEYRKLIFFTEEKLTNFDAVIATGSNNSTRYFEYYFQRFPHIIRKNRNSIAILNGEETDEDLCLLANDIFMYFGLGCRNVSKLYFPMGYEIGVLPTCFKHYSFLSDHNKYKNNYDYYKAIFMLDKKKFYDGVFFILNEDRSLLSPISVINYEFYNDVQSLETDILKYFDKLQCIVGKEITKFPLIPFGKTQSPELWDYADNIDTISFLLNLY